MKRLLFTIVGVGAAVAAVFSQARSTVFDGARIIDGNGGAPIENARLVVQDGRVTAVGSQSAVAMPSGATRVDASLRGVKLLLAEDDMRTAYSLSALLRGKGADVVTAETGAEALAALAEHADIRGVLMDVMMPEMDGYEAMRRLRQQARYSALPLASSPRFADASSAAV